MSETETDQTDPSVTIPCPWCEPSSSARSIHSLLGVGPSHSALVSKMASHLRTEHLLEVRFPLAVADFELYLTTYAQRLDAKRSAVLVLDPALDVEDAALRSRLRARALTALLERARNTLLEQCSAPCLFCQQPQSGWKTLFNHMFSQHGLNIGRPENLVDLDQLYALLKEQLHQVRCVYCERTFRDHAVLRSHMRKKKHLRLNPGNAHYHRFYISALVRAWGEGLDSLSAPLTVAVAAGSRDEDAISCGTSARKQHSRHTSNNNSSQQNRHTPIGRKHQIASRKPKRKKSTDPLKSGLAVDRRRTHTDSIHQRDSTTEAGDDDQLPYLSDGHEHDDDEEQEEQEQEEEEGEEVMEEEPTVCFYCEQRFTDAGQMLWHCGRAHPPFDWQRFRYRHRMDFYQCVRAYHHLRRCVCAHRCAHCAAEYPTALSLREHLASPSTRHHVLPPPPPHPLYADPTLLQPLSTPDPFLHSRALAEPHPELVVVFGASRGLGRAILCSLAARVRSSGRPCVTVAVGRKLSSLRVSTRQATAVAAAPPSSLSDAQHPPASARFSVDSGSTVSRPAVPCSTLSGSSSCSSSGSSSDPSSVSSSFTLSDPSSDPSSVFSSSTLSGASSDPSSGASSYSSRDSSSCDSSFSCSSSSATAGSSGTESPWEAWDPEDDFGVELQWRAGDGAAGCAEVVRRLVRLAKAADVRVVRVVYAAGAHEVAVAHRRPSFEQTEGTHDNQDAANGGSWVLGLPSPAAADSPTPVQYRYTCAEDFAASEVQRLQQLNVHAPLLLLRALREQLSSQSRVAELQFTYLSSGAADPLFYARGNSLYGPQKCEAEQCLFRYLCTSRHPPSSSTSSSSNSNSSLNSSLNSTGSGTVPLLDGGAVHTIPLCSTVLCLRYPFVETDMAHRLLAELLPVDAGLHEGGCLSASPLSYAQLFCPLERTAAHTAHLLLDAELGSSSALFVYRGPTIVTTAAGCDPPSSDTIDNLNWVQLDSLSLLKD